ncbi:MAG: hypothetical protein MAG795_00836 [Candidatus Woesearchaeota archaeon]|nr:hypothetical protein [Candidatus Woesearchaeota archaeon]
MSKIKENTIKNADLNKHNISAYVPMAYDCLREILEGICIMKGYKVTNHVCIEKILKSKYPNISFYEFNRFRKIRNRINYYGQMIEFEQGKEMIEKIFVFKSKMEELLLELI